MYYSGNETNEYSYAMLGFAAVYFFTALFLILAITLFLVARFKSVRKRLLYVLSTVAFVLFAVFGVMALTQSKPRCCGEGYTLNKSSHFSRLSPVSDMA